MPLSARVWLGMTALALSFFVRVDADASTRSAEIRGIVFQGGTDSVLPGVRVTCEGCSSVKTNRDGVFLLRGLKTGAHVITLSHDGQRWTSPEITTASGHSTELLVTLPEAEGVPVFSIEAPSADIVRVVQQPEESLGSGRIVGRVVRQDKGSPLRGASIYVRGQSAEAKSDAKGMFTLELPVGAHDITVLKPGFASATKRAIEVPLDGEVSVEVRLEQVAVELQAFTVLAPTIEGSTLDLLEERKEADRFTDFIGAEEMSKSGDSSAAGALRRVTGVTLVGGKYVYVRGLGERYSSTLLDGSTLPSPEPERRVVPLDLFPTSLLDSVVVEKSYTPDRPGEFAGGVVVLRTKSFPDEFEASVGLSLGLLQDSTFSAGLHGDSGPTDWLGIDGGYRALSLDVAQASAQGLVLESDRFSVGGFSSDELEMLGETLPNRWALERRSVLPDLGFDASIGTSWDFEGGSTGFLVALGYDQGWTRRLRQLKTFDVGAGGALEFQNGYDFDELNQNVTLSGMVTTGFTLDAGHEVQLTGLVARISDYDTREYEGFNGDLGGDIRITRLRWVERMLASGQLRGEHAFTLAPEWDLTLEWRYGLSLATRDEPDRREARTDYEEGDDKWYLSDRPEGNQRLFSGLEDVNHDVGVDASLSMPSWLGQTLKLKTGGAMVFKDREVDTRRYKFTDRGELASDPEITSLPLQEIFVPEHIGPDGFQLGEVTLATDNFTAYQRIAAGYLMVNMPVVADFEVMAGLRLEYSKQRLDTFKPFTANLEPEIAELSTLDVLPAVNLVYNMSDAMLLRAGYSRTLSRPAFRELSPAVSIDVTGGRLRFGNPELNRARVDNVDLRWEWYFTPRENLSLGAFFKRFQDPIETVVIPSAQLSISYANAKEAVNVGLELDARKDFSFIADELEFLSLGINLAWVQSRVELAEGATTNTSKDRALQGQSPFVVNVQLGYDNPDIGTRATLLYNVFGRRISEVGAQGAPDTFEEAFHGLDLVIKQDLSYGLKLSFKISNLLDLPVEVTQGDQVTETYRRYRKFSLGLGADF